MQTNVKKFKVPAIISAQCPTCGRTVERDLEKVTIYYPNTDEAFLLGMSCTGDDGSDDDDTRFEHTFTVTIELSITIRPISTNCTVIPKS